VSLQNKKGIGILLWIITKQKVRTSEQIFADMKTYRIVISSAYFASFWNSAIRIILLRFVRFRENYNFARHWISAKKQFISPKQRYSFAFIPLNYRETEFRCWRNENFRTPVFITVYEKLGEVRVGDKDTFQCFSQHDAVKELCALLA
jgi:hypothetical protein